MTTERQPADDRDIRAAIVAVVRKHREINQAALNSGNRARFLEVATFEQIKKRLEDLQLEVDLRSLESRLLAMIRDGSVRSMQGGFVTRNQSVAECRRIEGVK